jgi:hypothetical protein
MIVPACKSQTRFSSNVKTNMAAPRQSIVDLPLSNGKGEVSASAFALLFSELVQYSLPRIKNSSDLEQRLLFFSCKFSPIFFLTRLTI